MRRFFLLDETRDALPPLEGGRLEPWRLLCVVCELGEGRRGDRSEAALAGQEGMRRLFRLSLLGRHVLSQSENNKEQEKEARK